MRTQRWSPQATKVARFGRVAMSQGPKERCATARPAPWCVSERYLAPFPEDSSWPIMPSPWESLLPWRVSIVVTSCPIFRESGCPEPGPSGGFHLAPVRQEVVHCLREGGKTQEVQGNGWHVVVVPHLVGLHQNGPGPGGEGRIDVAPPGAETGPPVPRGRTVPSPPVCRRNPPEPAPACLPFHLVSYLEGSRRAAAPPPGLALITAVGVPHPLDPWNRPSKEPPSHEDSRREALVWQGLAARRTLVEGKGYHARTTHVCGPQGHRELSGPG